MAYRTKSSTKLSTSDILVSNDDDDDDDDDDDTPQFLSFSTKSLQRPTVAYKRM